MKARFHRKKFLSDHTRDLKSSDMNHTSKKNQFIFFKNHDDRKFDLKLFERKQKTIMTNDVTIFDDSEIRNKIEKIINK